MTAFGHLNEHVVAISPLKITKYVRVDGATSVALGDTGTYSIKTRGRPDPNYDSREIPPINRARIVPIEP